MLTHMNFKYMPTLISPTSTTSNRQQEQCISAMVLGLKAKNRRGPSVQVEYIIHIQDVKPWPPTQSLKTVRSVLIQWEIGDCNSGSTTSVTPSIDDGKIEFNESFRLTVVLSRDMSVKNGNADAFHKNLLEFNLYEPRRDKTVKGQLLGTAILDLADYGVVKEITSIGVPMNCTRSFRNTALPVLYLKIQPYDKALSSSSLRGRLSKEASLDKNDGESVSTLMSEEYADEAEVATLSDDDVSSHSSLTASSVLESNGSSPLLIKNGTARGKPHSGVGTENRDSLSKLSSDNESNENFKDYSSNVSVDISSSHGSPNNVPALLDNSGLETKSVSEKNSAPGAKSSTSCQALESAQQIQEEVINSKGKLQSKSLSEENASVVATEVIATDMSQKLNFKNDDQPQATSESEKKSQIPAARKDYTKDADTGNIDDVVAEYDDKHEQNVHERQMLEGKRDSPLSRDRLRHVKSVRSPMDSSRSNGGGSATTMKQESRVYAGEKGRTTSEMIAQELEQRIRMLEGELREAAAIEVALYSIAAEHGSSLNKVHAPARRLFRLYLQAVKGMRRASAAQSAVSGLVVVAKACGNDVPRLTFWLSNCIVLRAIVDAAFVEDQLPLSAGPSARNGVGKGKNKKSSTLKWSVSSSDKKAYKNALSTSLDWENPHVFISALEKVESWIFSRIVESVWWQTLTPHMQSSAAKIIDKVVESGSKRFYRRTSSSTDHEQVNFSLELWKKAFKDACERLCPVRAGGHECGCLSLLAKLIMEQCVARLDVAMFNAILRESADDIPTDPVSDPISDAKVLPIPAGKSSFGAGAQLKNAIGNWSRWLTDLFGMDDDDAPDDEREDDDDETQKYDSSFKSFHLLKSLSDLMMLPKDMLLNESIRREVCPTLSTEIIKRVLVNFVPDEFCPDPIPDAVFEALDSEDVVAEEEGLVTSFPCTAPEVSYSPPSASSLASLLSGYIGSGSQSQLRRSGSVLRRSNTSDDELDGLDSPLNSILGDSLPASVKEMKPDWEVVQNHGQNAIRYQLLRQVWHDGLEL